MHRLIALLLVLHPVVLQSQTNASPASVTPPSSPERGVYATVFRSPSTGVELRSGHFAAHAGFYPTVLRVEGEAARSANFIRAGGTWYQRSRGASLFVTPSVVFSLDEAWGNGALTEIGGRFPLGARANVRLGIGVLTTLRGETRVNPTVGLDVPLRRVGANR
jgi:hypothetical protein